MRWAGIRKGLVVVLISCACDRPTDSKPSTLAEAPAEEGERSAEGSGRLPAAVPAPEKVEPESPPKCDVPMLIALGKGLEPLGPHERIDAVLAGLAPCSTAIPSQLTFFFGIGPQSETSIPKVSGPELDALRKKACPEVEDVSARVASSPRDLRWSVVHEGCGMGRFELVGIDTPLADGGLLTWTMHQWLLDKGLEPDAAKPISLALFGADRKATSLLGLPEGLRVPQAPGTSLSLGPVVFVAETEISMGDRAVATLEGGQVAAGDKTGKAITLLLDRLGAENAGDPDLAPILVADASTPLAVIQDVVHTIDSAGYRRYAIAVEDDPYVFGQVTIDPPTLADSAPILQVFRAEADFVVRSHGEDRRIAAGDRAAITKAAVDLRLDDHTAHVAEIGGVPSAPFGDLVLALTAVQGPDCVADPRECVLVDLVLLESSESLPELGAGASGDAPATGIPKCDELFRRTMCVLEKTPDEEAKKNAKKAFTDSAKAWKDMAANEATKQAAEDACEQAVKAAQDGWKSVDC